MKKNGGDMLYNKDRGRAVWFDYIMLVTGTALVAFSVSCIYEPVGFVTGGFTGLAIVIKELSTKVVEGGFPLWLTNLLLNVPVFLFGYRMLGRKFIGRTLAGMVLLSMWLYLFPVINFSEGDYLLAALFGAVTTGIGMGLVLRVDATTGGTDTLAALLHVAFRQYSIVSIIQVLDGVIILMGFFIFGLRPTLYAIVAVYVTAKVSDSVMEGFKYAKAAFIITDKYREVSHAVFTELNRGATGLEAHGMYTGERKCVLYCVVSKKEIVKLKDIVVQADPEAFVIVSDVREVLGEGFLQQKE